MPFGKKNTRFIKHEVRVMELKKALEYYNKSLENCNENDFSKWPCSIMLASSSFLIANSSDINYRRIISNLDILVPGDTTDRIQELHMMILHILIEYTERGLFPDLYQEVKELLEEEIYD